MNENFHALAFPFNDARGLTKREYFAAAALQGLCAGMKDQRQVDIAERIAGGSIEAKAAVALADALLSALNKT